LELLREPPDTVTLVHICGRWTGNAVFNVGRFNDEILEATTSAAVDQDAMEYRATAIASEHRYEYV